MRNVWLLVQLWASELSRCWRKNDLDPVPFGERITLPSPSTVEREGRPRHDTMPSRQWPQHPGVHKAVGNKDWN